MNHSGDAARGHSPRAVEGPETQEGAGHILADEGEITLRVMGEFLTRKIPGRRTGGTSTREIFVRPCSGRKPPENLHERANLLAIRRLIAT